MQCRRVPDVERTHVVLYFKDSYVVGYPVLRNVVGMNNLKPLCKMVRRADLTKRLLDNFTERVATRHRVGVWEVEGRSAVTHVPKHRPEINHGQMSAHRLWHKGCWHAVQPPANEERLEVPDELSCIAFGAFGTRHRVCVTNYRPHIRNAALFDLVRPGLENL